MRISWNLFGVGLLGLLLLPTVASAQFTTVVNNNAIIITGYTGAGGVVTIPDSISSLPVTGIADDAFASTPKLTGVTMPNSVTNIGDEAFAWCLALTNVMVGSNVIHIGKNAFYYCNRLPAISVAPENSVYSSVDGVLFDKAQTRLIRFPGGKMGDFNIPASVTSIEDYAFSECNNVTNIVMPPGLTNIGPYAFWVCSLTNAVIGSGVTVLPYGAFAYCQNLLNVTLGSVAVISEAAFEGCTSLVSITIPDGVTSIGSQAFADCGLITITVPNSVTNLGDFAFGPCIHLTNAVLGSGVASMGTNIFTQCMALTTITVDPLNPAYSSLDGVLFDKKHSSLISYPLGRTGSYNIPDGVTGIAPWAFVSSLLTSLNVPNSLTNIGDSAFLLNSYLRSLYFSGAAPDTAWNAFAEFDDVIAYYLPGTTGWDAFGTIYGVRAALWNPQSQATDGSPGLPGNHFGFTITGTAGIPFVVEACTNPGTAWVPLQTASLTNGSFYFSDPDSASYPIRFYRIRSP